MTSYNELSRFPSILIKKWTKSTNYLPCKLLVLRNSRCKSSQQLNTPFYIFFLNPDYVVACPLRSLNVGLFICQGRQAIA